MPKAPGTGWRTISYAMTSTTAWKAAIRATRLRCCNAAVGSAQPTYPDSV